MGRKSEAIYKQMVRTLRHGFIDPETTDQFPQNFKTGTSKAQIVRDLRRRGYAVGKELVLHETKAEGITVTDVHRTGNIASGFGAADGYDLRDIENWTPQQKAKLTRTFNIVKSLSERPYQVYRPRKRENLELVQEAAHVIPTPPEINIAFVPVAHPGERADIEIIKREQIKKRRGKEVIEQKPMVVIHDRDVAKIPVKWSDVNVSKKEFQKDPVKATQKLIDEMAKLGINTFTPMAGVHEFPRSFNAQGLLEEIRNIMAQYSKERWSAFLLGIHAFEMPRNADLVDYRKSKRAAKAAQTAANKKAAATFRKQVKEAEERKKKKRGKRR